jgi:threonine aldolase
MRQAGVIAAAGIIALEHHVQKLAQDHAHAKAIARGLSRIPGVSIEGGIAAVETNIMFVNLGPVRVSVDAVLS